MTGITAPIGITGGAIVVGHATGTLPYTGYFVGGYIAFALGLIAVGLLLRVVGAVRTNS